MGQKDLTAKWFERSPEVFADIINAFVYEGEQVISSKDLNPAPTESLYTSKNGMLNNQYNDVSKYEMKNGSIVIQYTLENQSWPDYRILLRKAGYEGAIYRQQYEGKDTYPAITLVLYWGDMVWNPCADLYQLFRRKRIHYKAGKYIDNVSLHIYSMRSLPEEIRRRFKSDMRIVVDYLAEGNQYVPTGQKISDLEGVLRMLYVLTGEIDWIDNMEFLQKQQEKGENITMEYALSRAVRRGREEGIQEGKREGLQEGKREGIQEGRREGIQEGKRKGLQEGKREGIQEGKKEGIQQEKTRCAKAFVEETVSQKQSKEFIIGILQTCFQLKEEEAVRLYQEGNI